MPFMPLSSSGLFQTGRQVIAVLGLGAQARRVDVLVAAPFWRIDALNKEACLYWSLYRANPALIQYLSCSPAMRTLLLIVILIALPALAESTAGERSKPERWADRSTNCTTTTGAFRDPDSFLKWLDVFSDPGVYVEYARRSLDPDYSLRAADSLLDAGTARNFLEWMDPAIPGKWASALAQAPFYSAASATLFDPGRLKRWVMLPTNPELWQAAAAAINPETWVKWLALPANPRLAALIAKAQDPMTSEEWNMELSDRSNYPFLHLVPPSQQRSEGR